MKTLKLILRSELKDYSKEDFYDSLCYLADNTSKINKERKIIMKKKNFGNYIGINVCVWNIRMFNI